MAAGDLGGQVLHRLPQALEEALVCLICLDELPQQVLILYEHPGVVRRDLVHGRLLGQLHPLGGVVLELPLNLFQIDRVSHHEIPEGPVALRGQLLDPVGELMAEEGPHRVGIALLQADHPVLKLCVGRAAGHGLHHFHPEAQLLGHGVDPVVLPGAIGRQHLGIRQPPGGWDFPGGPPGQGLVIHLGKPLEIGRPVSPPVIGGLQGLPAALPQGLAGALQGCHSR